MAHTPVLLQEVIEGLNLSPDFNCIDGTLGAGGHARAMLERTSPQGRLIGFDRDRTALMLATQELKDFNERFIGIHDSYANIVEHAEELQAVQPIHAILVDLGLSSMQLDIAERGFSFRYSAPLDMRFDQSHGATAADVLNEKREEELVQIFSEYGEVRFSKRLARTIVEQRKDEPFTNTDQLVSVVESIVGGKRVGKSHPATTVFQALRIAVNDELHQLQMFIPKAIALLTPGGRFAAITFHSIEDRIVKHAFKNATRECICPPEIPECRCDAKASVRIVTKKPITPSEEEIQQNPRARSAKLRIIEKI